VGCYCETFEVLAEDLQIAKSVQSTAVFNVTCGFVEIRET